MNITRLSVYRAMPQTAAQSFRFGAVIEQAESNKLATAFSVPQTAVFALTPKEINSGKLLALAEGTYLVGRLLNAYGETDQDELQELVGNQPSQKLNGIISLLHDTYTMGFRDEGSHSQVKAISRRHGLLKIGNANGHKTFEFMDVGSSRQTAITGSSEPSPTEFLPVNSFQPVPTGKNLVLGATSSRRVALNLYGN